MFQQLKEFYLKQKTIIILTTTTLLLFFACFVEPLWWVAAALLLLFYATCDFGEILCYIMYFNLFSRIGTFYIVSLLVAFVVCATKYVVELVRKQRKFFTLPFVLTTLFVLIFSCVHSGFNILGFEQGVLVIALLYVVYLAFVYKDQINVFKCFSFLALGMVVSLGLSAITLLIKNFPFEIYHFDGTYRRLKLLCYHQNHLAMHSLFLMAYATFLLINKQGKIWMNLGWLAIGFVLGVLTMSKAFLLVCFLLCVYVAIYLVCKFKLKSLKFIVPALLFFAVIGFIFKDFLMMIVNRFVAYNIGASFINQITTGRSGIWFDYIMSITSSVQKVLFGVGLFGEELIEIGCHNVLIFVIYRTGLIGLLLLGILAWSYFKESKHKIKISFKNILMLALYVILSFNEMIFSDRFFMYLIFGILLISSTQAKENLN